MELVKLGRATDGKGADDVLGMIFASMEADRTFFERIEHSVVDDRVAENRLMHDGIADALNTKYEFGGTTRDYERFVDAVRETMCLTRGSDVMRWYKNQVANERAAGGNPALTLTWEPHDLFTDDGYGLA